MRLVCTCTRTLPIVRAIESALFERARMTDQVTDTKEAAWKYGRLTQENGPCMKSWNALMNTEQFCLTHAHLGTSVNVP